MDDGMVTGACCSAADLQSLPHTPKLQQSNTQEAESTTDFSNKAPAIDDPCRWSPHLSDHLRVSSPSAPPSQQAPVFTLVYAMDATPPGLSPSSSPVLLMPLLERPHNAS